MRIGSLCSGGGGLDLAVEQVFGATTAWHCEIDPAASKVLAHRWPGVPNHRDLIATDWSAVEPIDILCAGWPCQPWSAAGKQKGADDERAIWPEIARAIRILRPRIIVLENVPTVIRLGELERVANSLSALGYDLRWTCLRASDVGAPHQRERLWIIVTPDADSRQGGQSNGHPAFGGWPIDAEQARMGNSRTDGLALLPTPAASRSGRNQSPSPGAAIRPSLDMIGDLLPTPTTRDHKGGSRTVRDGDGRRPTTLDDTTVARGNGGASSLPDVVQLLPTPGASDTRGQDYARAGREGSGGEVTAVVKAANASQWGKYAPAIQRWEASLTRPAPSPTEPNTKGNPRLNPAFSEWMMGWPAGWVTDVPGISRNDQLRIVGNGVCPQQAHAALTFLLSLEVFGVVA